MVKTWPPNGSGLPGEGGDTASVLKHPRLGWGSVGLLALGAVPGSARADRVQLVTHRTGANPEVLLLNILDVLINSTVSQDLPHTKKSGPPQAACWSRGPGLPASQGLSLQRWGWRHPGWCLEGEGGWELHWPPALEGVGPIPWRAGEDRAAGWGRTWSRREVTQLTESTVSCCENPTGAMP